MSLFSRSQRIKAIVGFAPIEDREVLRVRDGIRTGKGLLSLGVTSSNAPDASTLGIDNIGSNSFCISADTSINLSRRFLLHVQS
jgi:hypothetical protein